MIKNPIPFLTFPLDDFPPFVPLAGRCCCNSGNDDDDDDTAGSSLLVFRLCCIMTATILYGWMRGDSVLCIACTWSLFYFTVVVGLSRNVSFYRSYR